MQFLLGAGHATIFVSNSTVSKPALQVSSSEKALFEFLHRANPRNAIKDVLSYIYGYLLFTELGAFI